MVMLGKGVLCRRGLLVLCPLPPRITGMGRPKPFCKQLPGSVFAGLDAAGKTTILYKLKASGTI